MQSDARATWLLGLGAAIGLSVAAGSLLVGAQTRVRELSSETVATVNGVPIQTSQFLRAVEGLASDRREALSEADRVHVLDRLIEEELLVQHALDLGLAQRDRRTRSYLVSSVLDSIVAETEGFSASPGEVQDFYAEHGDYFARPGRLRVQQVFISLGQSAEAAEVAAAQARGEAAAQRLRAGEDLAVVQRELGDREIAGVPNVALPPVKLREYLGPSVLEIAQTLEAGAISEPVRSPQGLHVLWMIERQEAGRPALTDVEAQVLAEMKRRAGDQALRQSLDDLRAQAAVVVSEPLP